ncbi:MAG: hypothetical protein V1783_10965 [Bacteroidota bacterium]
MDDKENIFDKIREITGKGKEQLNILEEQINIALQVEYFEYTKNVKQKINKKSILNRKDKLFDPEYTNGRKKKLLCQLASIDDVSAYRAIEGYIGVAAESLKDWAVLALQESRMLLESSLLDESQIFISTGLGGKGNKLRYFIVVFSEDLKQFNAIQEKIIRNEFDFMFGKSDEILEDLAFHGNFVTFTVLVSIHKSVQQIFEGAITECNQYGNFIKNNFVITNVKRLSKEEITTFIEKNDFEPDDEDLIIDQGFVSE